MSFALDPSRAPKARGERLFSSADWDYATLQRIYAAVEEIALTELKLDCFPNQIEVITAEQMLDAYSSIGMPLFYKHWSFGKHFARDELLYRKGMQGLAYEIVINSNPCIAYLMEENSATMQTLVIAHAAFGHNHFFKNNYLFKQWTDADGILDYLEFAKGFAARCEDAYGAEAVERVLDAAHALMGQGVHRYPRRRRPDLRSEQLREAERRAHCEQLFNDLWRTVPSKGRSSKARSAAEKRRALLGLPEENILYFLEKTAPRLAGWQRELLRIVRNIAQYFYPQSQTKVMNEGCATYVHHRIMRRLHEKGLIDDGAYLEFIHTHTNVVFQPGYSDKRYSGLNPYALGFAIMEDIERVCVAPTNEDRVWFPDIAGNLDPYGTLKQVWANYRDESFIAQFLSPKVIRDLRLFHIKDDEDEDELFVESIHDERGYRRVRRALSRQYDVAYRDADIQIVDVDLEGDRKLIMHHTMLDGVGLNVDAPRVLQHLADLWGYEVLLQEISPGDSAVVEDPIEFGL
ncbi:MAG: SpoVR family protein [Alphaproteobacteria bacterium]|nr:SpoVR family protein [Alphaproteobacteria bacterium]